MKPKPQILSTRLVKQTRLFSIEEVDIQFGNGQQVCYERLKGTATGGGVLIVPIIDKHLLLVKEYSVGVEDYQLMFPKGKVEANEPVEEAANRELQEEVGFAAEKLQLIKSMSLAPGYISHQTHIVVATDLYPSSLPGDEPESLEVVRWPIEEIDALVTRDDVSEGRSIAAAYMVRSLWEAGKLA